MGNLNELANKSWSISIGYTYCIGIYLLNGILYKYKGRSRLLPFSCCWKMLFKKIVKTYIYIYIVSMVTNFVFSEHTTNS